ncbi:MAG: ABC transporter permease, partial [Thermodesulfobacteriota bacterium]
MNLKRIRVMFRARNMEFFRDRAAFGWNFLFPFLIVAGFTVIFGGDTRSEYKVGVFPHPTVQVDLEKIAVPEAFKKVRYLDFIGFPSLEAGLAKLRDHKIDFLIQLDSPENAYWVSEGPKGYVVEQLFNAALVPEEYRGLGLRGEIEGRPV